MHTRIDHTTKDNDMPQNDLTLIKVQNRVISTLHKVQQQSSIDMHMTDVKTLRPNNQMIMILGYFLLKGHKKHQPK